ncbi:hypothetical protein ACFY3M_04920 [Streptomyces mirabilis]|uniref:hypothetical protein n=1 Tax=Streptomyces mirabilis TaxID=68239 RepID=UPI0036898BA3
MTSATMTKAEMSRLLLETIGSPIGTGTRVPRSKEIESLTEFAFKSRVGLLFLDECLRKGVALGPAAHELHESLTKRRHATDDVIVRLTKSLDEVAKGEWVLFKSIKPFASTPNDTDWFPFDPKRHEQLVRHLTRDGAFKLLEQAPCQTTLIESSGEGITDTTKAGGVYYIDCYIYPSTDYFIYLDPRRLRTYREETLVNGVSVPVLAPHAELAATMFHNVFPERSFSIESYYLIKCYLEVISERGCSAKFVQVCRDQKMEYAASANLALVRDIDRAHFGIEDPAILALLRDLGHPDFRVEAFDPRGSFPYEFPNRVFWTAFISKQRDRTSLTSTGNQVLHMLNPVFFADVVKIIWRRSVKGGVYQQN